MRKTVLGLAAGAAAGLLLVLAAACGDDNGGNGAPAATPPAEEEDAPSGDGGAGGSGGGRGSATLTIGDESWTFDNYYCAFGAEETRNDRVSFSSGAFGMHEGTRIQLDASIQDPMEQDRLEGDGVIHSITLDDVEDFENPSVSWSAVRGIVGGGADFIEVGDGTVRAETTFDDGRTDEIEEVAGSLEATCGE